jgi:hypothetical protein
MKHEKVTLGITTLDNTPALLICLSGVLSGSVLPARIQLRFEGQLPSFENFYFEQLAELARLRGVVFEFTRTQSKGIRAARDWHLSTCPTDYLWFLDDDVLADYDCLDSLCVAADWCENFCFAKPWVFLAGVKVDVNNRRGYADYHRKEIDDTEISQNHFYKKGSCRAMPIETLDAGNCMLHVPRVRQHGINFDMFPGGANSGGEDTLFAYVVRQRGLYGYLAPNAQSVHLEKEQLNFTEIAARTELVRLGKELYGKCNPANISAASECNQSYPAHVGVDTGSDRGSIVERLQNWSK